MWRRGRSGRRRTVPYVRGRSRRPGRSNGPRTSYTDCGHGSTRQEKKRNEPQRHREHREEKKQNERVDLSDLEGQGGAALLFSLLSSLCSLCLCGSKRFSTLFPTSLEFPAGRPASPAHPARFSWMLLRCLPI